MGEMERDCLIGYGARYCMSPCSVSYKLKNIRCPPVA